MADQQIDDLLGYIVDGRAVALRLAASPLHMNGERLLKRCLLFFAMRADRIFMDQSMVANLVAALQYLINGSGILFNAPGRDEK